MLLSILFIFLLLGVAIISTIWPKYEDRFFELGVLGKNKTMDEYYPNLDSNLRVGSQVSWYIHIRNHVGNVQNLSLRVKLINSTTQPPNDHMHEPSPSDSFVELPLFFDVGEEQLIPFSWSILDVTSHGGVTTINRMIVNDQDIEVNVSTNLDSYFLMVFELWAYDQFTDEYKFEWKSGTDSSSVSTYLEFNVRLV